MSARALAERSGVSAAYLSRLESGKVSPTVGTLGRITEALGESMSRIFDEPDTLGPVVRKDERRTVASRGAIDALLSPSRNGRLEVIEMTVEPGAASGDPYTHFGEEECVVILDGEFEITVDGTTYSLHEGDAITFDCHLPHAWRNPGSSDATALWIITPASGHGHHS